MILLTVTTQIFDESFSIFIPSNSDLLRALTSLERKHGPTSFLFGLRDDTTTTTFSLSHSHILKELVPTGVCRANDGWVKVIAPRLTGVCLVLCQSEKTFFVDRKLLSNKLNLFTSYEPFSASQDD